MTAMLANMIDGGADDVNPFAKLNTLLSNSPHDFLRPTAQLQEAALQAAKAAIDPLAISVANAQLARQKENRRKRKRDRDEEDRPILHSRQLHITGFEVKQVWAQAQRVLDAACEEVDRQVNLNANQASGIRNDPNHLGTAYDREEDDVYEEEFDVQQDDLDADSVSEQDDTAENFDLLGDNIEDEEDIAADSDLDVSSDEEPPDNQATFTEDPNKLNDGFFSIDDFNKQSQFLEQMDARGDDDNPSDEDEIDWGADPLAMSSFKLGSRKNNKRTGTGKKADDSDSDDDNDDNDGGPTFGNANIHEMDESDDEELLDDDADDLDGGMNLSNANDINYADFFEPPPRKTIKTKRMRALPKTQPEAPTAAPRDTSNLDDDIERAMADVRRDLLDSEDEDDFDEDEDDEGATDDELHPKGKTSSKNLSTHEKQRAAIASEIRRLETANVAKRDWQLSGEARAADRPKNSLIEEDLEFERAGKPVPVVTAETSEEIEQLIKRRILAREFDEVIRRSALGVNGANETRRGRIEVDDTKPQTSLGEIYEQEHLKSTDAASYVDKRSVATKKQHETIDVLWKEVNDQLNLLSNLHFKPKRVNIEMKTVEDKPRIAMEDARPVGEIESGEGGMLAPQEVYKPGIDSRAEKGEVLSRNGGGGITTNKDEMTKEERLRRRRREKERSKKAQNNKAQTILGKSKNGPGAAIGKARKKEQEKADIISDLKKGNVKLVGKDGILQSMGKNKKGSSRGVGEGEQKQISAGNLKL